MKVREQAKCSRYQTVRYSLKVICCTYSLQKTVSMEDKARNYKIECEENDCLVQTRCFTDGHAQSWKRDQGLCESLAESVLEFSNCCSVGQPSNAALTDFCP